MNYKNIIKKFNTPRFWTLFANLAIRGAGFITSFFIARMVGASALGIYSSLVNTASTAVLPFSRVLTNNATISATHAYAQGEVSYISYARVNALLACILLLISMITFIMLYQLSLREEIENSFSVGFVLLIAFSVMVAALYGAVVQGFYNGAGNFVTTAKWYAITSVVVIIAAFPMLQFFGLTGAFILLIVTSIFPLVILSKKILSKKDITADVKIEKFALKHVIQQSLSSMPSIAVITINAGVGWLCTIYLVQAHYGMAEVGLIAIAIQWQTLILMPATSWGNVTLKLLGDSMMTKNKSHIKDIINDLIRKNLLATFVAGVVICALSILIAHAYGLESSKLAVLICLNALAALVMSINNVHERLFLVMDKQSIWFLLSSIAFLVQVIFTMVEIQRGIVVIPLGMAIGALVLVMLSHMTTKKFLDSSGTVK